MNLPIDVQKKLREHKQLLALQCRGFAWLVETSRIHQGGVLARLVLALILSRESVFHCVGKEALQEPGADVLRSTGGLSPSQSAYAAIAGEKTT